MHVDSCFILPEVPVGGVFCPSDMLTFQKHAFLNWLLAWKLVRCESTASPTLGPTLPALEKR